MAPRSLKVAVIGAGVSGLIAAKELQQQGLTVIVFEKNNRIGGTWVYDPKTDSDPLSIDPTREIIHSSLYHSLRTNLPRQVMGFLDYPFSKRVSGDPRTFPGHEEVLRFLEDFAGEFGIYGLTRFETEVVKVERNGKGNEWVVESRLTRGSDSVSREVLKRKSEFSNMGSGEMGVAESDGASLPSIGTDAMKRRVTYFYEPTIGDYYYGQGHPMKPHRIRMAHNLVIHYALHRRMQINRPFLAGPEDIRRFHADDYVDFLSSVSPEILSENSHSHYRQLKRFNVGEDCPVFDGLFPFCQASAGGSIGAAVRLNRGDADIAINWAGGLHHAKKAEASGFCYVNDIVLGILELLKVHRRVVYVDIDVHHGDGVEEAFYTTDRVMTVSFHKFGDFFPGTGHIKDTGFGSGKDYAVNVPLNDGMDDENFRALFRPIMQKVMDVYQPDAVVLQCGADSLSGDRLGCFNLSVKGHADCLRFLRSFNVPLMVLGGGGYTVRNVARCWCYETAVAVGVEPSNKLPYNEYYEYFGPDYTLHVEPNNMENLNTPKDMEKIRNMLLEQISRLPHAPSAPFQTTPPTVQVPEEEDEDMDMRPKPRIWNGEDYDSEDDDEYEDEKASIRSSGLSSHMRRSAVDMEEDKPDVKPDVHSSSSS